MELKISGYSDDNISFSGAINDEIGAYDVEEDGELIATSDGTLIRVKYDDQGIWRFEPVVTMGKTKILIKKASNPDAGYSDVLTVKSENLTWVAFRNEYVVAGV